MATWELGELARAAEATIRGGALPVSVEAVGTDSRSLPSSALFVALRGDRFDGHGFVESAVEQGALAVMVDAEGDRDVAVPRLVVADTLRGLGELAAYTRRLRSQPVVAITGSNGKTTTKELCAAALASKGPVHKTLGNLNNLIGVPLTLFAWPDDAVAAVVEMGMNAPGEIARLTEMAAPQVGIVTNVAAAHLEGLGNIEAVAKAKGELYDGLGSDAVAVVNADDATVNSVCAPRSGGRKVLRFGRGRGFVDVNVDVDVDVDIDVQVLASRPRGDGLDLTLRVAEATVEVALPLAGQHNAMNAAAAAAAAHALGVSADDIATGLARATVPGGRSRILRGVGEGLNILDDTYNANPDSMRAAFATCRELSGGARCIAVLGDMFELGETARTLHRQVGADAGAAGMSVVIALGQFSEAVAEGAAVGGAEAHSLRGFAKVTQWLDSNLRAGDWILVKGSRGMKMERFVVHLTGEGDG